MLYVVANQTVKRSGVGADGWVLSSSVPVSAFSPRDSWWDLQPVLLMKTSPNSRIYLVAESVLCKYPHTLYVALLNSWPHRLGSWI